MIIKRVGDAYKILEISPMAHLGKVDSNASELVLWAEFDRMLDPTTWMVKAILSVDLSIPQSPKSVGYWEAFWMVELDGRALAEILRICHMKQTTGYNSQILRLPFSRNVPEVWTCSEPQKLFSFLFDARGKPKSKFDPCSNEAGDGDQKAEREKQEALRI